MVDLKTRGAIAVFVGVAGGWKLAIWRQGCVVQVTGRAYPPGW
jgi:hypothetical protein